MALFGVIWLIRLKSYLRGDFQICDHTLINTTKQLTSPEENQVETIELPKLSLTSDFSCQTDLDDEFDCQSEFLDDDGREQHQICVAVAEIHNFNVKPMTHGTRGLNIPVPLEYKERTNPICNRLENEITRRTSINPYDKTASCSKNDEIIYMNYSPNELHVQNMAFNADHRIQSMRSETVGVHSTARRVSQPTTAAGAINLQSSRSSSIGVSNIMVAFRGKLCSSALKRVCSPLQR